MHLGERTTQELRRSSLLKITRHLNLSLKIFENWFTMRAAVNIQVMSFRSYKFSYICYINSDFTCPQIFFHPEQKWFLHTILCFFITCFKCYIWSEQKACNVELKKYILTICRLITLFFKWFVQMSFNWSCTKFTLKASWGEQCWGCVGWYFMTFQSP